MNISIPSLDAKSLSINEQCAHEKPRWVAVRNGRFVGRLIAYRRILYDQSGMGRDWYDDTESQSGDELGGCRLSVSLSLPGNISWTELRCDAAALVRGIPGL